MGLTPNWPYGYIPTQREWADAFAAKLDDLGYVFIQPGNGQVLESTARQGGWVLDPPTELASLAVVAPPGDFDGQRFIVSSTQNIDSFTATAPPGQFLRNGGPYVLAQGGVSTWIFRLANTTWYVWG